MTPIPPPGPTPDWPAPPEPAGPLFGDRLGLAVRYVELLASAGIERGLIGPRERGRLWDRHVMNSAAVGELIAPGSMVIDVGSGAGLPGIPLALARPDLSVVLVEPLLRRSTFLSEVVAELGLERVEVRRARAEELTGLLHAPYVAARAVAPIDRLARWCLPLLTRGGELLALKGERAAAELAQAEDDLSRLGVQGADVVRIGEGTGASATSVIRVRVSSQVRSPDDRSGRTSGPRERRRRGR